MERYLRVFNFSFRVFGMAAQNPLLLAPIAANIVLAAPFMLGCAVALQLVESDAGAYTVLAAGVTLLYFIDYFCNAVTASLICDQVTDGRADLGSAFRRVQRVLGGIAIFAAISAAFDLLQAYASERNDIVAKLATRVLYALWTTATYVVLPAMVIEGLTFGSAFARSKQLASEDPTNVGIGAVAIGVVNYALGGAIFYLAHKLLLSVDSPFLGAVLFYTIINVYWAISGYLKITYFTCFYLWARECERTQSASPSLAPAPLAAVL
ncbi:MAG TPA: DUF6159 family protein [Polyangiales bacterium]|nr:DUF6159 family protein [Polyangiales bacterium]